MSNTITSVGRNSDFQSTLVIHVLRSKRSRSEMSIPRLCDLSRLTTRRMLVTDLRLSSGIRCSLVNP